METTVTKDDVLVEMSELRRMFNMASNPYEGQRTPLGDKLKD